MYYKFVNTAKTWAAAATACRADSNAYGTDLATIQSLADNYYVHGVVASTGVNVWLGLTDSATEGAWMWNDGRTLLRSSAFWKTTEPFGRGDCAIMTSTGEWADGDCTDTYSYVCAHQFWPDSVPPPSPPPPPTAAPTVSPTAPTKAPTKSPTVSPTKSPTVSPTKSPTVSPTKSPTVSPTAPTKAPTKSPTVSPTKSPTVAPTKSPTVSPTKSPTVSPSF
jgi:hypothetical protein